MNRRKKLNAGLAKEFAKQAARKSDPAWGPRDAWAKGQMERLQRERRIPTFEAISRAGSLFIVILKKGEE